MYTVVLCSSQITTRWHRIAQYNLDFNNRTLLNSFLKSSLAVHLPLLNSKMLASIEVISMRMFYYVPDELLSLSSSLCSRVFRSPSLCIFLNAGVSKSSSSESNMCRVLDNLVFDNFLTPMLVWLLFEISSSFSEHRRNKHLNVLVVF